MFLPTLPQTDPSKDARAAALAASRASVDFERSRPGLVMPSDIPPGHGLSPAWMVEVELLAAATEIAAIPGALEIAVDDGRTPEERLLAAKGLVAHWLAQLPKKPAGPFRPLPWTARAPLTVAEHGLCWANFRRPRAWRAGTTTSTSAGSASRATRPRS